MPRGPFSLAAAARFIAGWPPADAVTDADAGAVRLCFALDSFAGHAGVTISEADGALRVEAAGDGGEAELRAQVERILSLDHDGSGMAAVLADDPVAAGLHRAADGLRPVLFHSPYEAAAWSIISARVQPQQARGVRQRLSEELGRTLAVGGVEMAALPLPERILALESFAGLPGEKVRRLRAVAEAAIEGRLDAHHLRELDHSRALEELREIRGIGPFYAGLILIRGAGPADVLPPGGEPRLRQAVGAVYGLDGPATDEELTRISDGWRPYRTWIAVLMRASQQGEQ